MSALRLTARPDLTGDVDLTGIVPDRIAGLDTAAIARLSVRHDGRPAELGELFAVTGSAGSELELEPGNARLHGVGGGLRQGTVTVHGDAGDYAAQGMHGGTLRVHGRVGSHAGTLMRGGLLEVDGDAGDFLGAARPGDRHGLRGGTVIIHGNAGDRVGDRMRRGLLLVEGDAGSHCATRMLAGTIGVLGRTGHSVGFGMRRGTLLLGQTPEALASLFNDCGTHALLFLSLWLRTLDGLPTRFAALPRGRAVQRFVGDQSVGGKAELLVWNDD